MVNLIIHYLSYLLISTEGEAPAGEATQILNEENKSEQTVNADESKTNTDQTANAQNPDNIVNNNHEKDPLTSINMLKGKAEKVKPLQFEFVASKLKYILNFHYDLLI